MNEKTEALRLADAIDYTDVPFGIRTAAELRRLHTENQRLRGLLTEAKDLAWSFGADSLRNRIDAAMGVSDVHPK